MFYALIQLWCQTHHVQTAFKLISRNFTRWQFTQDETPLKITFK